MTEIFDELLQVTLREAPLYPGHFVSKCGRFVRNTRYENITKVYNRNSEFAYLQSDGIRIHRLVASAWVFNPFPERFDTVDHMDWDTQNNSATNLRWLSRRLNAIYRRRKRYYSRIRTRTGRVYYESKIRSEGVVTRKYSPSKEEAEKKTKSLINEMFRKVYTEDISNAPPGLPRNPGMFLWTDSGTDTPRLYTPINPGNIRPRQVRTAGYSL